MLLDFKIPIAILFMMQYFEKIITLSSTIKGMP